MIGVGALGLGSVFYGSYRPRLERLARRGRIELRAVYDLNAQARTGTARRYGLDPDIPSAEALIERDDVELVLVLTSMPAHGALALAALKAGKHVLVEKPMATSLDDAAEMVALANTGGTHLVCAPHVLLSPTYRAMHQRVRDGVIGDLHTGRARYGWPGPWWGSWFYQPGGGALFDLAAYNITSLCGFFGPAKRVSAMVGTRVPRRMVDGQLVDVKTEDNAHILIDHGDACFSTVMTGFTIQRYRTPAVELYGSGGTLQMLGHDWAPEGFELSRNDTGAAWELFPELDPTWHWTSGLDHLVDQIEAGRPTVTRPEHAYHVLEVMLAAKQSSDEGRVVTIDSDFPEPDFSLLPPLPTHNLFQHDPRSGR